jgi:uncharacterized coiled-coil protein SlyX
MTIREERIELALEQLEHAKTQLELDVLAEMLADLRGQNYTPKSKESPYWADEEAWDD